VLVEQLWRDLDPLDLTEGLSRRAGQLSELHRLRAYHAVHLASVASVADRETVLVAADGDLVAAARTLGIATARLS
jgi:hypothetical protein